jgi:hypothetical protein
MQLKDMDLIHLASDRFQTYSCEHDGEPLCCGSHKVGNFLQRVFSEEVGVGFFPDEELCLF